MRGTLPDPAFNQAAGIQSGNGAAVEVVRSLVDGNHWMGVVASGDGSLVEVSDCTVTGTLPAAIGEAGLTAAYGGSLFMERTLVAQNSRTSVWVSGEGTFASLEGCLVRDTLAAPSLTEDGGDYTEGRCLTLQDGAEMHVHASLLLRCAVEGVLAHGESTQLLFESSVLDDTLPAEAGEFGGGLQASGGAQVEFLGSLVAGGYWAAITAAGPGSVVNLNSSIIRDVQPSVDYPEPFGFGLAALDSGLIGGVRTLVTGNATAGVLVHGTGTVVTLESCAVTRTVTGGRNSRLEGHQSYGDGVALEGATLEAVETLFTDNSRTGVFFSNSSGHIERCVSTGNGSFGLVLKDSVQNVSWEDRSNWIWGNGLDLPLTGLDGEVTVDPYGLPIPAVPPQVPLDDSSPSLP